LASEWHLERPAPRQQRQSRIRRRDSGRPLRSLGAGGGGPNDGAEKPHTQHVGLLDGTVTTIPGGIRLTGNAILTTNGNTAPFSGSPIVVEITGGNTVQYSNMKLMFLGASTEHFGSQQYDGVVTIER
jgi:hypothetical protein